MSDTLKALDDLGELLDQLASNAREFDYNTANRMERDAAKALLAIEAAVNALPELVERVKRYEAALKKIDAGHLPDLEGKPDVLDYAIATRVFYMKLARAALKETGQ